MRNSGRPSWAAFLFVRRLAGPAPRSYAVRVHHLRPTISGRLARGGLPLASYRTRNRPPMPVAANSRIASRTPVSLTREPWARTSAGTGLAAAPPSGARRRVSGSPRRATNSARRARRSTAAASSRASSSGTRTGSSGVMRRSTGRMLAGPLARDNHRLTSWAVSRNLAWCCAPGRGRERGGPLPLCHQRVPAAALLHPACHREPDESVHHVLTIMPPRRRLYDGGLAARHAVREQLEDGGRDALDR